MKLVLLDTVRVQDYVFNSNRLKENIGASYLVAEATLRWALESVPGPSNLDDGLKFKPGSFIESDASLAAEVVYAGGGNVLAMFRDDAAARKFRRWISEKALTRAPGLQLVMVDVDFDWATDALSEKLLELFRKAGAVKAKRRTSRNDLGLGVTVACQSTNMAATGIVALHGGAEMPLSSEARAKIAVTAGDGTTVSLSERRLLDYFPAPQGFRYPSEFDKLGRTEEAHSFIAVVHLDGDGMGQRIEDLCENFRDASQNRDLVEALRVFSENIKSIATRAFRQTLELLFRHIEANDGKVVHPVTVKGEPLSAIVLSESKGEKMLPVRPIVFGGDDLTFVCDGRIGLSLATTYIDTFASEWRSVYPDAPATVSAGIAIVKSHFPFSHAYYLSEELCRSAKQYKREKKLDSGCLDWHFASGGFVGSLREIRSKEFNIRGDSLTLRPVTLMENDEDSLRSWRVVRKGIAAFQSDEWVTRRNKMKALRDALVQGGAAVEVFRKKYLGNAPLPELDPRLGNLQEKGWQNKLCGYFDALEIADWHIPLKSEERS